MYLHVWCSVCVSSSIHWLGCSKFSFSVHWCTAIPALTATGALFNQCPAKHKAVAIQSIGVGAGSNATRGGETSVPPSTVSWPSRSTLKGLIVRLVEETDHQSSASALLRISIVVWRMWDITVKYVWHSSCTHRWTWNASKCIFSSRHSYTQTHTYDCLPTEGPAPF